jgi:N-formylglutamate amidohydrolase
MTKLIIHVPHASTNVPDDVWPEFLVARDQVECEISASADLYTDQMAKEAWPDAEIIEASVSRIVVDVERYDDDAREEMAQVGRGVIYTHDHHKKRIRHDLHPRQRAMLLAKYYAPHWSRLREAAAGATLIDLHTYPADPWPIERHAAAARPEIDIGFSKGLTPEDWVSALTLHFAGAGYEVGHNTPYSGVIDAGAQAAVMIEIRRDIVGIPGDDGKWCRLIKALNTMPLRSVH